MNSPILINLIPYREEVRANQVKMLALVMVGVLLLAGAFYYGVYRVYYNRLSSEQQTVTGLQNTVHSLHAEIKTIVHLRKTRENLIDRENLITDLQNKRDMVVSIFNALARETPRGVFLSSVKQAESTVNIRGYAVDNEVIADFMRNIKGSKVFSDPQLYIISTTRQGAENVKQFTLHATLRGIEHSPKMALPKSVKPVKAVKTGGKP